MRHLFRYYLWLFWNLNIITLILSILSYYKFNTVYCEENEETPEWKKLKPYPSKEDWIITGLIVLLILLRTWSYLHDGTSPLDPYGSLGDNPVSSVGAQSGPSAATGSTDVPVTFVPSAATGSTNVPVTFDPSAVASSGATGSTDVIIRFVPSSPPPL